MDFRVQLHGNAVSHSRKTGFVDEPLDQLASVRVEKQGGGNIGALYNMELRLTNPACRVLLCGFTLSIILGKCVTC